MKDKKELYYSNVKDLTNAEIESLGDHELNICDKCGNVDNSIDLWWTEYSELNVEEFKSVENWTALCDICWERHWQAYNKKRGDII